MININAINPYLKAFTVAIITTLITIINSSANLAEWRTWVLPVSATVMTYLVPNAQPSKPVFPKD